MLCYWDMPFTIFLSVCSVCVMYSVDDRGWVGFSNPCSLRQAVPGVGWGRLVWKASNINASGLVLRGNRIDDFLGGRIECPVIIGFHLYSNSFSFSSHNFPLLLLFPFLLLEIAILSKSLQLHCIKNTYLI